MIPLRDENPTRTTPFVLYAIIVLNIAVFLYNGSVSREGNPLSAYVLIPRSLHMGSHGGMATSVSPWFTIFTSMFMHANILHISGNMLYLWIFGNNIEDVLGHFKFLLFYLAAGFAAAMGQVLLAPNSAIPMIGASGAIAGVLGAYLFLYPRARVDTLLWIGIFIRVVTLPAAAVLGFWIVFQVFVMASSGTHAHGGVAYAAHVGGFFSGVAMIIMSGGRRLLRGRRSMEVISDDWSE